MQSGKQPNTHIHRKRTYTPDGSQFCVLLMDPLLWQHLSPGFAFLTQWACFPEAEHTKQQQHHQPQDDLTRSLCFFQPAATGHQKAPCLNGVQTEGLSWIYNDKMHYSCPPGKKWTSATIITQCGSIQSVKYTPEHARTHLQPRKRKCSQSQVRTSMMMAMGKLKMNHVPKFITFASG